MKKLLFSKIKESLISIFYKYTHIAITFENFKGSNLKCLAAPKNTTLLCRVVFFIILRYCVGLDWGSKLR